ncbi:MAG: hypothetical protein MJZ08_09800 [Bacteroidaceae bacterium]|nr:hypothetical protein [Bacteroidaceae bacterium]
MNLYLRYFDKETFAYSIDEALDFLYSIDEIGMNAEIAKDVADYVESNVLYPKRYKVRQRVYFIVIKTEAANMQDFKEKKAIKSAQKQEASTAPQVNILEQKLVGWYEGTLTFKRVSVVPGTQKFQYLDTTFVARCKASSGTECYNRIVNHLRERVDARSQFPAAKGKYFKFTFLGKAK